LSLTDNAARQVRDVDWNYDAHLNLKLHITHLKVKLTARHAVGLRSALIKKVTVYGS